MQTDPLAALLSVLRSPSHRRRGLVVCLYWLTICVPPSTLLVASPTESSLYVAFAVFVSLSFAVGFAIARLQLEVIQEHLELQSRPMTAGEYVSLVMGLFVIYLVSGAAIAGVNFGGTLIFEEYAEMTDARFDVGGPETAARMLSVLASLLGNAVAFGFLGYGLRAIASGDRDWMGRAIGYAAARLVDPTGPQMIWIAYVYVVGGGLALVAGALSSTVFFAAAMGIVLFAFAVLNTVAFPIYFAQIRGDHLGLVEIPDEED